MSSWKTVQPNDGSILMTDGVTNVGVKGTTPAAGSVGIVSAQFGPFVRTTFTFNKTRLTVTDAAGSGSSGSLLLYTFPQAAVSFLGTRQDYTAFAEGAALTGAAGDAAFEIGIGTSAATAGDGTLANGVFENVGQAVAVTLSGGTGSGTVVDGARTAALNGTATALALYLNWSGSAATIDATSTIDVTGTATVCWLHMGDD